jgi:hypothetical protein
MSPARFGPLVEEYLAYRRGLGFALESSAWLLRDFARYADRVGHEGPLTSELAVGWALRARSNDPAQAARRLSSVRQFARYLALLDPATEVPPAGLLGGVPRRGQPHIYSDAVPRNPLTMRTTRTRNPPTSRSPPTRLRIVPNSS